MYFNFIDVLIFFQYIVIFLCYVPDFFNILDFFQYIVILLCYVPDFFQHAVFRRRFALNIRECR